MGATIAERRSATTPARWRCATVGRRRIHMFNFITENDFYPHYPMISEIRNRTIRNWMKSKPQDHGGLKKKQADLGVMCCQWLCSSSCASYTQFSVEQQSQNYALKTRPRGHWPRRGARLEASSQYLFLAEDWYWKIMKLKKITDP